MRKLVWILFPLLTLAFFNPVTVTLADTITTKTAELTDIHGEIDSLQNSIEKKQRLQTGLQQQLRSVEIKIGDLSQQLYQLNSGLNKEKITLAKLKKQQEDSLTKLTTQNKALAQQIRAAYRLGEIQQWKVILNQQDVSSISRHVTYYRYLSEARVNLIGDIKATLTNLALNIQDSRVHEEILKNLVQQKEQEQALEQRVLVDRQKIISMLNSQNIGNQQELQVLMSNQIALQKMITHLKAQKLFSMNNSFSQLKGKLTWPVRGQFVSSYGSALDVGDQRLTGVVIKAKPGSPVHAVASGKVIFANWLRGFGLLVIVSHGNNYISLYGRNQAIYAKVGSSINAGDVIAATGNSGGYDKSSLYFEIRQNGSPVNPGIWCR